MNLRINAQSAQASLFTQAASAMRKWRVHVITPTAAIDDLRLSSASNSLTDRLKEQGYAIEVWNNKVIKKDNRVVVKPLKFVDEAISNIGTTLEEMKTLSMLAEREDLSDEVRIDLQIQMIKIQSQLFKSTYNIGLHMSGIPSSSVDSMLSGAIAGGEEVLIAMMENMKTRIASGDYTPRADGVDLSDFTLFNKFFANEDRGEATRLYFKGDAADLGLDEYMLKNIDIRYSGANDLGVAVTNVACAKESTERIQKQIDDLSEFKEEFAQFYANVPEEGYSDNGRKLEIIDTKSTNMPGAGSVIPTSELLATPGVMRPWDDAPMEEYGSAAMSDIDQRIRIPRNQMDAFIHKADSFFKDEIYKHLGFSLGKFSAERIMDSAANAHKIKMGTMNKSAWDANGNYIATAPAGLRFVSPTILIDNYL